MVIVGVAVMSTTLLADIGGSKSRFALGNPSGALERVVLIHNDTVAGLDAAVAHYLEETGARPRAATLAVAVREGVKIVLGPGTGLGVAALLPAGGRWHVVASEGGHASFGPQAADEVELFARLRDECGSVSAETVLSGPGLVRLAHALDPRAGSHEPENIVASALAREPAAHAAAPLFVRLLGSFAGGLGLPFQAVGCAHIISGGGTR